MNKNGLSLIELMMAMGLLTAIMLPVFFTFSTGTRNIQVTESEFRAHSAALELMEQIISLPFQQIPIGDFTADQTESGMPFGELSFKRSNNEGIEAKVSIEELKRHGKVRFKKVAVTVSFLPSRHSENSKNFTIKTLVANEKP